MTAHTHPSCIKTHPSCPHPDCVAHYAAKVTAKPPRVRKVKPIVLGTRNNRWHPMCSRCQSHDILPELTIQWTIKRKHHYCKDHTDSRATDLELQGRKRRGRRARRLRGWTGQKDVMPPMTHCKGCGGWHGGDACYVCANARLDRQEEAR